jgi:hypothetical protein
MGWAQSPPYFCAFTETVMDINNDCLAQHLPPLPHPLYPVTQAMDLPRAPTFHPNAIVLGSAQLRPLSYHDIYIDDFISIAQTPCQENTLTHLLHAIDSVFDPTPSPPRHQAISITKLDKGDAAFSTQKRVLGWDIDTERMAIGLPDHRLTTLHTLLSAFLSKQRTSRRKWRQLLGVLRSSTPAIYGAVHLFSILQYIAKDTNARRLRLSPLVKAVLRDWLALLSDLHHQPAQLHMLVPTPPSIVATTDASRFGMGGAWSLVLHGKPQHYLWRSAFPDNIRKDLVTARNPTGSLNINELELLAMLVGASMASQHSQRSYDNVLLGTDNTAACTWLNKGSITSASASAFLLHQLARLRRSLNFNVSAAYVPGMSNQLADSCSRLFTLPDSEFLSYMNDKFPVQPSWKLATPPTDLLCSMNYALSRKLQPLASQQNAKAQPQHHGISGLPSARTSTVTPTFPQSLIPYPYYKFTPTGIEMAPWLPVALQLNLEQWRMPYAPWGRRSPHWAVPTHASKPRESLTSGYPANYPPIQKTIRHPPD